MDIQKDLTNHRSRAGQPSNGHTDLHKQFIQLGREKNKIQYKLLAILPAIFKTEIYKKYTKTIEGYAWRFAQIPRSVVEKTLKLEKHLENKPFLKEAVGQVGINKVGLLASFATPETDESLADKARHMSKSALQELSKELRARMSYKNTEQNEDQNRGRLFDANPVDGRIRLQAIIDRSCRAVPTTITIQLDEEMTFLFLKLKQKYPNQNNQEVMKKVLLQANECIVNNYSRSSYENTPSENKNRQIIPTTSQKQQIQNPSPGMKVTKAPAAAVSRYIRKSVKLDALQKSNQKCSYTNCNKPPAAFHHPERYARIKQQIAAAYCFRSATPASSGSPSATRPKQQAAGSGTTPARQPHAQAKSANSTSAQTKSANSTATQTSQHANQQTDPHANIKPLCKNHHEFMHNGLVENETQQPQNWQLKLQSAGKLHPIDGLYRKYRQQAQEAASPSLSRIDQLYRQYRQAGGYA